MNPFIEQKIAISYDDYYNTELGKKIDALEKEAILKLLSDIDRTNMLELGCGTGHWTECFSSLGFKITAIDISEHMINVAKTKNIPNTTFLVGDANCLKFEDNSFNIIASITMLEFVENPTKALNEMYRLTKPNGFIIIGFLNADSNLFKNINENSTLKYAHLFTKTEIYNLLKNYGTTTLLEAVFVDEKQNVFNISSNLNSAFIACKIKILK